MSGEYLSFLHKFRIEDTSIGQAFVLDIRPYSQVLLIDKLKEYFRVRNSDYKPVHISSYQSGYVQVSSFDGGQILLKQGKHKHNESAVYMWETSSGHFEAIEKISDSYEKFILTNANFDKIYDEEIHENDYDKHETDCYRIIDYFNPDLSDSGRDLWRWLI